MKLGRDERGAVVVEFALVLPLLVLFVFGIVEFGRAYNAKIELTSAVREGARITALGGPTISDAAIRDKTRQAAAGLDGDGIQVTSTKCPAPSPTSTTANATVTASYDFTYDIPFLGSRSANLTATGVMRCAG